GEGRPAKLALLDEKGSRQELQGRSLRYVGGTSTIHAKDEVVADVLLPPFAFDGAAKGTPVLTHVTAGSAVIRLAESGEGAQRKQRIRETEAKGGVCATQPNGSVIRCDDLTMDPDAKQ